MVSIVYKCNKGFTIVEFLVVITIASILVTVTSRFFVTQSRLSEIENQVSFMQKNVRTAMETIVRDVMNAGAGVPLGEGIDPMTPGDGANGDPDSLVINANFDYQHTTLFEDEGLDQTIYVMSSAGFYDGGLLYIEDFNGGEFHTVTGISLDTPKEDQITISQPLSRNFYKDDTIVSPIARVSYQLSWSDPHHPKLLRAMKGIETNVLADNIEDLQFLFVMDDGSETPQPADMTRVRMVKITMTSRVDRSDCEFDDDGYRRRTLETHVKPRNLDLPYHK